MVWMGHLESEGLGRVANEACVTGNLHERFYLRVDVFSGGERSNFTLFNLEGAGRNETKMGPSAQLARLSTTDNREVGGFQSLGPYPFDCHQMGSRKRDRTSSGTMRCPCGQGFEAWPKTQLVLAPGPPHVPSVSGRVPM